MAGTLYAAELSNEFDELRAVGTVAGCQDISKFDPGSGWKWFPEDIPLQMVREEVLRGLLPLAAELLIEFDELRTARTFDGMKMDMMRKGVRF